MSLYDPSPYPEKGDLAPRQVNVYQNDVDSDKWFRFRVSGFPLGKRIGSVSQSERARENRLLTPSIGDVPQKVLSLGFTLRVEFDFKSFFVPYVPEVPIKTLRRFVRVATRSFAFKKLRLRIRTRKQSKTKIPKLRYWRFGV